MRISPRLFRSLATLFALCLSLALAASAAHAQESGPKCTFSISSISFGTVDVKNGRPYDATGTLTYACTGDSREIVRICPSLGLAADGNRFMTDASGNKLTFNLYSDTSRITVWGTWYSKIKAPSIDVPIGRSQTGGGTATIYARLDPGQQSVAPGVYNSTINGRNSAFAYDYASKGTCDAPIKGSGARVSVPVTITARVGEGGPASQPIVAPDATHTTDTGSGQVTTQSTPEKRSVWQKLADNAKYQQEKNQGNAPSNAPSGPKPLCKMSDSDVHLVDGNWAGPNCITANADGKPAHPEDVQQSTDAQEKSTRAEYIESHACMTTIGPDKAADLAAQCTKATDAPHTGCSTQQNTCDEIRDATKHGCDRLGASAPDFCFAK